MYLGQAVSTYYYTVIYTHYVHVCNYLHYKESQSYLLLYCVRLPVAFYYSIFVIEYFTSGLHEEQYADIKFREYVHNSFLFRQKKIDENCCYLKESCIYVDDFSSHLNSRSTFRFMNSAQLIIIVTQIVTCVCQTVSHYLYKFIIVREDETTLAISSWEE